MVVCIIIPVLASAQSHIIGQHLQLHPHWAVVAGAAAVCLQEAVGQMLHVLPPTHAVEVHLHIVDEPEPTFINEIIYYSLFHIPFLIRMDVSAITRKVNYNLM
jgi:hypothetical protein